MKCPYRNFEDCIVEKCPSCNYEEVKEEIIAGRWPSWMSTEEAIKQGNAWHTTKTKYKFISCRLADKGVQPAPVVKQEIDNSTRTTVVVRKSIF